jgi:hypothetical protein
MWVRAIFGGQVLLIIRILLSRFLDYIVAQSVARGRHVHGIDSSDEASRGPPGDSPPPKPVAHEKRRSARQRKRFRVSFAQTSSFTLDVSTGGFATEMMRVPPPGTPLVGRIRMQEVQVPFSGQVVWSKPGDARMNIRGRMGVRFSRIRDDFPSLLDAADNRR